MVAVRVGDEELKGAIRAGAARQIFLPDVVEMILPLIEIVGTQGEVVASRLGSCVQFTIADQVQFLEFAQPKPSAGEVERRPLHWLQLECVTVKLAAFLHIGDVKRDVI